MELFKKIKTSFSILFNKEKYQKFINLDKTIAEKDQRILNLEKKCEKCKNKGV